MRAERVPVCAEWNGDWDGNWHRDGNGIGDRGFGARTAVWIADGLRGAGDLHGGERGLVDLLAPVHEWLRGGGTVYAGI